MIEEEEEEELIFGGHVELLPNTGTEVCVPRKGETLEGGERDKGGEEGGVGGGEDVESSLVRTSGEGGIGGGGVEEVGEGEGG